MNKCDKSECGCSAVPSPEGLCGCGNPVRYMTPSGGACNKYSRCLPYAEQGEAREAKNTQCAALTELLKEARKIIRASSSRQLAKDWDRRATKALRDEGRAYLETPASNAQAPAQAAHQQEAPAMHSGWVSCTIEFDGSGPEEVAYGPKIMMDRLAKWLGKHFERTIAEKAAPQPLPASQGDALDAARLDWLLLHISGAEFRRIGVHYSGNARRADVDAARKQGANHD